MNLILNDGWKFYKGADNPLKLENQKFISVNLPHTCNNLDGQDGGSDYYRGVCAYLKTIDLNKKDDKEYYLEFNGVSSIACVYVNDELVMEHRGGFAKFRCNITKFLNEGINVIKVSADNRANDIVYPQTADFTFFGGIYRDVKLIEANLSRFNLDYYGSEGVRITPIMNGKDCNVSVDWYLTNPLKGQKMLIEVSYQGTKVLEREATAQDAGETFELKDAHLWDGVNCPNLYQLNLKLVDEDNKLLDERNIDFGCRSYEVRTDGFYLNGKKYQLNGVSRHQDRLDMGWAISKKEHEEDMALIKEMGTTSIRLAHYQHDDYFYDLCDRNGMVVWAEIPYISVHMNNGDENALLQMKELVIQQYNHPSICMWGISNEITIGGESPEQLNLHHELNDLVKSLDKTRPTTLACVTMCDTDSPLTDVTDFIAYNHYLGWYIGDVEENGPWLDDFRLKYPHKPIGLSEYGCEAILSLHSDKPTKGDYTEEYQSYYHEKMLEQFEERPWIWGTYCWNMFDFAVDSRDEGGCKGRNNKGLVTYDRLTKKDSFYIYKAHWSDEKFVHIASKRYLYRPTKNIELKVYSNCNKVSLYVNDKLVETKDGKYVFTFNLTLGMFGSKIKVVGDECSDSAKFKRAFFKKNRYQLKKEKKQVENWFMKDGVKYEFKFPAGKFTIKDKFNTIYATEEGKRVLNELVKEALTLMNPNGENDPEKFLKSSRKLIGGMSIERIANFAGDKMPQELLYHVSEELNKIDKPEK